MKRLPISRPGLAHGLCTMVSFGSLAGAMVIMVLVDYEVEGKKLIAPLIGATMLSMGLFEGWKRVV